MKENALIKNSIFNNGEVIPTGWYWVFPGKELKKEKVKRFKFNGEELVIFRTKTGKVNALSAFCPHMGAHFEEGHVRGERLHCAFHDWQFDCSGKCTNIPTEKNDTVLKTIPKLSKYHVREKYEMIWIYSGQEIKVDIPEFEELRGMEVDVLFGSITTRQCHPSVVMLNAIDANHFNTVHPEVKKLAGEINLEPKILNQYAIRLENTTSVPPTLIGKLLSPFYKKQMTYSLDYWFATNGLVTLGPDFLHLYLMFPKRIREDGGTEGQAIYITKKRKYIFGKIISFLILYFTKIGGGYFENGDKRIFDSIKFSMKSPVKSDKAIISFIKHTEAMETIRR